MCLTEGEGRIDVQSFRPLYTGFPLFDENPVFPILIVQSGANSANSLPYIIMTTICISKYCWHQFLIQPFVVKTFIVEPPPDLHHRHSLQTFLVLIRNLELFDVSNFVQLHVRTSSTMLNSFEIFLHKILFNFQAHCCLWTHHL